MEKTLEKLSAVDSERDSWGPADMFRIARSLAANVAIRSCDEVGLCCFRFGGMHLYLVLYIYPPTPADGGGARQRTLQHPAACSYLVYVHRTSTTALYSWQRGHDFTMDTGRRSLRRSCKDSGQMHACNIVDYCGFKVVIARDASGWGRGDCLSCGRKMHEADPPAVMAGG